jgi:hypothetical protein
VKRYLVTFIKARPSAHGGLVLEPDSKILGPNWPVEEAALGDVVEYLAVHGFYNDVQKAWILPGAVLSVQELAFTKRKAA